VGFPFDCNHVQSLFGSQSFSPSSSHVPTMNAHNIVWLTNAHNLWWQEGETTFYLQNNTTSHQQWKADILFTQCIIFPLLMSPHLGMDKFTILFQMTKDMM
jgi:hypothetical protein